jgi:hypothetical protein
MKTQQFSFRMLAVGLLAITTAVVASMLFSPAGIASADPGTPVPPKVNAKATDALEKFYQREIKMLGEQGNHLDKANDLVAKAQDYIAEQKANGKNVAKLEAALAKLKTQVVKAQSAHDEATSILNQHAGFDANGHVTDPVQARPTVAQAQKSLNEARRILGNITQEIARVLKGHRDANNGD